jgi:hypothetical protein
MVLRQRGFVITAKVTLSRQVSTVLRENAELSESKQMDGTKHTSTHWFK